MAEARTTAHAFHQAEGVDDWRVLYWGAHTHYPCASFAQAAALVAAIADAADAVGHAPTWIYGPTGSRSGPSPAQTVR